MPQKTSSDTLSKKSSCASMSPPPGWRTISSPWQGDDIPDTSIRLRTALADIEGLPEYHLNVGLASVVGQWRDPGEGRLLTTDD
jgi:hypothetical protein